jgi:imidazolonepropionase-like amidohydrolase
MRRLIVPVFLCGWLALNAGSGLAATKVIKFGKLVDGTGRVLNNAFVVVEDDRIKTVTTSAPSVPGAEMIDLSAYTGIPGLIDVHTHLTYGLMPPRRPIVSMVRGRESARKALEIGVTTVRDLGSVNYEDIAMRDLINMGDFPGPRMFVAGCGIRPTRAAFQPGGVPPGCGVGDGPAEFMRNVREQIAAGADVIKIFASTGSGQNVTGFQTVTYEEMKAAIDVAHNYRKKVAIHSYGPDGARDAVRAGTDSLEHPADLDDETIAEMVRRKTWYVPTIDHNRYYADNGDKLGYEPGYKERLNDFIQRNLESAKRAFKAGVRFAMGSDAVYSMWGENTRELGWFVKAGMTPEQALTTATSGAALLLGMEKSLGSVAPGYFADLVAVQGDPLQDVNVVINNVRWVMKAGVVVSDRRTTSKSN